MSYTYTELFDSRRCELTRDGYVETRIYNVTDSSLSYGESIDCELIVQDAATDSRFRIGADHPDDVLTDVYCTSVTVTPTASPGIARMEAKYEPDDRAAGYNDDGELWEFEIATQKGSMKDCSHIGYMNYGIGGSSTIAGGVIGMKDDGSIEGVDIEKPVWRIRCTKLYKDFDESDLHTTIVNQINAIAALVGKINNAAWMGGAFQTGCVLFLGANVSKKRTYEWQIEYNFLYNLPISGSWTLTDLSVVTLSGVPGHDVIDIQHDKTVNAEGFTTYSIRNIGIRQVYEAGAFGTLGLVGI